MDLPFQIITDGPPSHRLETLFTRYWPAYRRWIARSAVHDRAHCVNQLRSYMPELVPLFEQLQDRFGGGDEVGRFLTLYRPPRVVRACTQVMIQSEDGPVLLRSYDHGPRLIDGIVLRSQWTETPTLAVTDCLWAALDGINGHGLAIALAFGGRNVIGDGFSAALICRYVLETCSSVKEAREALARLPVYMPYTFAVVDATGEFVTAFLGPDIDAIFVTRRTSANHQRGVDWPEYARFVESVGRLERIESLVDSRVSIEHARQVFLSPPVWRTSYAKASGTLYVAEYSVQKRSLTLHWPGSSECVGLEFSPDRSFTAALPLPG